MSYSGIYGITDDALLPEEILVERVEYALKAGLSMLQYRSKNPDKTIKQKVAHQLSDLCKRYDIPLLINDDPLLAKQVNAEGVHLGQADSDLTEARNLLGPEAIIGITCHAQLDLAINAEANGADYVAFGRFFPSRTKPDASPASLDLITEAKQKLTVPVVAIGGINPENGAAAVAAGADMLAVIHALFAGDDVTANTNKLVQLYAS